MTQVERPDWIAGTGCSIAGKTGLSMGGTWNYETSVVNIITLPHHNHFLYKKGLLYEIYDPKTHVPSKKGGKLMITTPLHPRSERAVMEEGVISAY